MGEEKRLALELHEHLSTAATHLAEASAPLAGASVPVAGLAGGGTPTVESLPAAVKLGRSAAPVALAAPVAGAAAPVAAHYAAPAY